MTRSDILVDKINLLMKQYQERPGEHPIHLCGVGKDDREEGKWTVGAGFEFKINGFEVKYHLTTTDQRWDAGKFQSFNYETIKLRDDKVEIELTGGTGYGQFKGTLEMDGDRNAYHSLSEEQKNIYDLTLEIVRNYFKKEVPEVHKELFERDVKSNTETPKKIRKLRSLLWFGREIPEEINPNP